MDKKSVVGAGSLKEILMSSFGVVTMKISLLLDQP